jgi:hypothetical protein
VTEPEPGAGFRAIMILVCGLALTALVALLLLVTR